MKREMKAYWLRVLAAFLLLKLAGGLMRDAEHLLAQASDTRDAVTVEAVVTDG